MLDMQGGIDKALPTVLSEVIADINMKFSD